MIQRASDMDGWPEEHQQMAVEVLYAFDMFLLAAGCASNAGLELARDRIVIERLAPSEQSPKTITGDSRESITWGQWCAEAAAESPSAYSDAARRMVYRAAVDILATVLELPERQRMMGKW